MTAAVDITAAATLSTWDGQVSARLRSVIDEACRSLPSLRVPVLDMVAVAVPYRLLAMAVLAALTGDPMPALPVCVVSRLWWAGAETLDDMTDGQAHAGSTSRSLGEGLVAGVACLALLTQLVIDLEELAPDIRRDWQRELTGACLRSAEGQLTDLVPHDGDFSWGQVVASYRGKTGEPYARDAVMAARLATSDADALRGWRAFGALFGVLRQLHNDAASAGHDHDEDLMNGTRLLRIAHALEVCPPTRRPVLLDLRDRARSDPSARAELRRWLAEPTVADGYRGRVDAIRQQTCTLLDRLASPSPYRDLLHTLVHNSGHGAWSWQGAHR